MCEHTLAYGCSFIYVCKTSVERENVRHLSLPVPQCRHPEHNFGHGKENLSNFLMTLNLLSYLFHTMAHLFDRRYLLLRKTLPSRKTFFQDVQALTKYFFYESWDHHLQAMIVGLELEDPGR